MKHVLLLLSLLSLLSCTRASNTQNKSTLKFDFSKVQSKNSVLVSNFPETSQICYGVNVMGPDIAPRAITCGPQLGLTAGFVASGSELSIEVPSGEHRQVELYMYLPLPGEACPLVDQSKIDSSLLYKVGTKSEVSFNTPEVTLEIPVVFPGYDHSIHDDLALPASCMDNQTPPTTPPVVNPNAPKIISTSLSSSNITSSGVDESLTLTMLVSALYQPNWLNFNHYGPMGNVSGSYSAHMFYACTSSYNTDPNHICYGYDSSYYFGSKTFLVSQWAPNGNYGIDVSVQDTMYYTSAPVLGISYNVSNHAAATPPSIVSVNLVADAGLTSGAGGNIEFKILVSSSSPPDFVNRSLRRPDSSYVFGGGSGVSFTNCSSFIATGGHICFGQTANHWFTSFFDNINQWQPNGTYSYDSIDVRNAALLWSGTYGNPLTFNVSGNTTPTAPTITQIDTFYAFDNDPLGAGIPYYPNTCVKPSYGTNLSLGMKIFSTSNAPVNWINYGLISPSLAMIIGGGNGIGSTYLGGNSYSTDYQYTLYSVAGGPRGVYKWDGISVANAGSLTSNAVGPLEIHVQDSCHTYYASIKSTNATTCGITLSGELKCWGNNTYNQIDHGTTSFTRAYPVNVAGYQTFTSVSPGGSHNCAIDSSNHLYCWGYNLNGQIGDGTTNPYPSLQMIDGANFYAQVSSGSSHTCAITMSGTLKCWGANSYGQLGDGTTTQRTTPVVIDGANFYQSVSAGFNHTCGITTAGILKCWGLNTASQLGDGTATNRPSPTVINSGTSYIKIASATSSTCGITNTGVLKCWGQNSSGQLGDGTVITKTTPTVIDSGVSYQKISTSASFTCGITVAGDLKCWGNNVVGQLGNGTVTGSNVPLLISSGILEVTTGNSHTCAITNTNDVKCWGDNSVNQLGDGTNSSSLSPILIDQ